MSAKPRASELKSDFAWLPPDLAYPEENYATAPFLVIRIPARIDGPGEATTQLTASLA